MKTITATALLVSAHPEPSLVTLVPRTGAPSDRRSSGVGRGRARLPELPVTPLVGPVLVVGASIVLAAGTAGLWF